MKKKKPTIKEIVAKVEMLTRVNNIAIEMIDNVGNTIKQYIDPVLTLRAEESEAWTLVASNVSHLGKAGRPVTHKNRLKRHFKIKYTASHGSNFTVVRNPIFSNLDQTASDWTNSVPADNGGTMIDIENAKITGTGTQALVITADVYIRRWGYEDVTMVLNLNSLINV